MIFLKEVYKMNETMKVLLSQRSIRKFTKQEIEPEKLHEIISAAQWTATSSYFQTFTIINIKDPEKRATIAEIAGGQPWVVNAPVFLMFCADLHRAEKYWKDADKKVFSNHETFVVATVDAALAAQKAYIAAQSLGLGGVFVGGIRNDIKALCDLLKLPQLVYPVFGMCLGYPLGEQAQRPRLPLDVIFKTDTYDETKDEALINEYDQQVKEYYINRTSGKIDDTWSERCAKTLMEKPRYEVKDFIKAKGFTLS